MSEQQIGVLGRVVKVLPAGRLVIDVGLEHGVRFGDVFAIVVPGDAIEDPETGASLGVLERVKAHLVADHVQPGLTQLVPPAETRSGASPTDRVLSARLADTDLHGRGSSRVRRGALKVGDQARRVER